ncbi:hypothetical protein BDM02DRAFT_3153765 [Thelephora ganbajun]|uniref:Uncharacterized protein n=1 Tax=Thelephora ganbajun TaxID=370292 RepID=A0ACB6ZRY3_THEGA|nr:hypothetical protein BDM02DRAFT_3153765 [Thelephora ganbajun]
MPLDRRSFKSPPTSLTSIRESQAARRAQRREQRYDSARQLDILSDLNLGPSDDEDDDSHEPPRIIHEGISQFASLLSPEAGNVSGAIVGGHAQVQQPDHQTNDVEQTSPQPSIGRGKKKKAKRRQRPQSSSTIAEIPTNSTTSKASRQKSNQWANRCMYAELLELNPGPALNPQVDVEDGLPDDLDTGAWIAISGVPVGKRCLAVTYTSSGIAGTVPNTVLRSRLVGKHLLPTFPSILPQNTILDCILDQNWTQNGILHVLDVIKWKGQDIGDCETSFRFWWRDTRIQELLTTDPNRISEFAQTTAKSNSESATTSTGFPYPMTFVPVPYHSDISLPNLLSTIIPMARSPRMISMIPRRSSPSAITEGEMQVDTQLTIGISEGEVQRIEVQVQSEGLLLYVSQATYEPGTSPLSTWVPTQFEGVAVLDLFEKLAERRFQMGISREGPNEVEMDI